MKTDEIKDNQAKKTGRCLLVSGGEFAPLPEKGLKFDYIIACDKGYEHCRRLQLTPDLVIGDFDSCGQSVDAGIAVTKLNPIKDDTDTISAVRRALELGFGEIHIACAFGGRFDHSMANVQTAAFIAERGGRAVISGADTVLYSLKDGELRLPRQENCYLSVFALSEKCEGVTISGTKYTTDNVMLTNSYPIGVSNEWVEEEAVVRVEKGMLAVIISRNIKIV